MFEDGEGEFGVGIDAVQGAGLGFLETLAQGRERPLNHGPSSTAIPPVRRLLSNQLDQRSDRLPNSWPVAS